jgi:CHASE3 domain sensor protein
MPLQGERGDMFNSIREELESTVTPLLKEIVDDARKLMRQEAELVRTEVREEGVRARQAFTLLIAGSATLFISLVLCAFMLVQLIATEWLKVPLWAAFGIVAVVMALVGGGLSFFGGKKLESMRQSSGRSMQALREGFGWMQRAM